jgi:hypothetical protein
MLLMMSQDNNGVAGGDSGINVLDNDTLNGTAVNPADVVISTKTDH